MVLLPKKIPVVGLQKEMVLRATGFASVYWIPCSWHMRLYPACCGEHDPVDQTAKAAFQTRTLCDTVQYRLCLEITFLEIGRTPSTLACSPTGSGLVKNIFQPLSEDRLQHMALWPSKMNKSTLSSSPYTTRRLHHRMTVSRSSYLRFVCAWTERLVAAELFGQIPRLTIW